MLNNRGIYYAKLIVKGIDDLKDELLNKTILKPTDLGANSSLADISSSVSTEFSGGSYASIIVEGYSKVFYRYFYHMGQINLDSPELAPAYSYFKELKDVYDSSSLNKPFNYYKKYRVWAFKAKACLKSALELSEQKGSVGNRQHGSSYSFEANVDDVLSFSSNRGDEDFTKMGLKLPNSEGKYILIETSEIYKEKAGASNASKINVILNIIYEDDKEKNSKIYPITTVYNNKPLEIVKMISANDLIDILKNDYHATWSATIVDNEPLYQKLNEVGSQCLQSAYFFATGKNKIHQVYNCEINNSWPSVILRANTPKDLANIPIFTSRSLEHAMTRKSQRRDKTSESNIAA